jgi:hypothetical protein
MQSTVICVTGWHFPYDFYQSLSELESLDVFVVSHRKPRQLPGFVSNLFSKDQILFRPNIGYDWGCYQQFVQSNLWRSYQTIIFMHDDLEVHNFGFVSRVNELLQQHAVIGNGAGDGPVTRVKVSHHPYAYAHSSWKPGSYNFEHRSVRGSFLAVRKEVLEKIRDFEVYWDPWKVNIDFGNWSTKATCGKIQEAYGSMAFGYLAETFGTSEFITEFIRGQAGGEPSQPAVVKDWLYMLIKRVSRYYMEILYCQRKVNLRGLRLATLRIFLMFFSRKK